MSGVQLKIPRRVEGRGSEVQGGIYRSRSSTTEAPPPFKVVVSLKLAAVLMIFLRLVYYRYTSRGIC